MHMKETEGYNFKNGLFFPPLKSYSFLPMLQLKKNSKHPGGCPLLAGTEDISEVRGGLWLLKSSMFQLLH